MNDDVVSIWQSGVGKKGVECVELFPCIGEVFLVGGCKMGVDAGQSRVGAVVNTFYQFDGTMGVNAASAHSRLDVDVNIEDIVASVQWMGDVFRGLGGGHDRVEAVVCAGEYPVGGAVGYDGLEDENGLSVDEADDMKGFVEACHGEEIDVSVFEYVDHLADTVSVGVGFYDGAELRMRRAEALECGEVAEQSFCIDVALQVGPCELLERIEFHFCESASICLRSLNSSLKARAITAIFAPDERPACRG